MSRKRFMEPFSEKMFDYGKPPVRPEHIKENEQGCIWCSICGEWIRTKGLENTANIEARHKFYEAHKH